MWDCLTIWRLPTIFNNHCGISYLFSHHSSSYSTRLLWCRGMGLDQTMQKLQIEPKLWCRTNRKFLFPPAALTVSARKHLKQQRCGVFITQNVSATVCFRKCSCFCNGPAPSLCYNRGSYDLFTFFVWLVVIWGGEVGGTLLMWLLNNN